MGLRNLVNSAVRKARNSICVLGAGVMLSACGDTINYYGNAPAGQGSASGEYNSQKFCDNMLYGCCVIDKEHTDKCLDFWGTTDTGCEIVTKQRYDQWVGDETTCLGFSVEEARADVKIFLDCLSTKCDKGKCGMQMDDDPAIEQCLDERYNSN